MVRAAQGMATILVALSSTALWKALTFRALAQIQNFCSSSKTAASPSTILLTENQLVLLGMSMRKRKRCDSSAELLRSTRPTWLHPSAAAASPSFWVPIHPGFEKESSALGCNNSGASTWVRRGQYWIRTLNPNSAINKRYD